MKRLLKILRNNENFKWNCCRKVNIKEEWSMNNNLIQAKKDLKAFAKRAKNVTVFLFGNGIDYVFYWDKYVFECIVWAYE